MATPAPLKSRLARGVGAFVVADLITGLAAFSVITLGGLWLFSATWLKVTGEAAAKGIPFGSAGQTELAWLGLFGTLPLAGVIVYLAIRAYDVPKDLFRTGGDVTGSEVRRILRLRPQVRRSP